MYNTPACYGPQRQRQKILRAEHLFFTLSGQYLNAHNRQSAVTMLLSRIDRSYFCLFITGRLRPANTIVIVISVIVGALSLAVIIIIISASVYCYRVKTRR